MLLLYLTSLVLSVHSGASNVMLALRSVGLCTHLKPATYIQSSSVHLKCLLSNFSSRSQIVFMVLTKWNHQHLAGTSSLHLKECCCCTFDRVHPLPSLQICVTSFTTWCTGMAKVQEIKLYVWITTGGIYWIVHSLCVLYLRMVFPI